MQYRPTTMRRDELRPFHVTQGAGLLASLGWAIALTACGDGDGHGSATQDPIPLTCESVRDAPSDLARFARLSVSGTRNRSGGNPAIESRDSIATIRDDSEETSWKVPLGESFVEVDLQPALGRAVALSHAAMQFDGPPPKTLAVDLLDGCGGNVRATLPWSTASVALDFIDACAACIRIRLQTDTETSLKGLELITHDAAVAARLASRESLRFADGPPPITEPNSGVIEGFYGVPWSWRERKDMLVSMALGGLGLYLYAPKDDDLHRSGWRVPYPDAEVAKFGDFATVASELGITPFFGVSPFGDYDTESADDYNALLDKLLSLAHAGFTGVALLADDIDLFEDVGVSGALGAAHADVMRRLLADILAQIASAKFIFVPTVYNDAQLRKYGAQGVAYLEALASLDADVQIMWTGSGVFADTMTATDLDAASTAIGRAPLIWDNYWANDITDAAYGRVLLGPLRGREAALPSAVSGLAFNPSIQGGLSRLALSTAAAFLRAPADYDPESARSRAAENEAALADMRGDMREDAREPADALGRSGNVTDTARFAMELFDGHGLNIPANAALETAHVTLKHSLEKGPYVDTFVGNQMLAVVARMAVFDSELHHSGLLADVVDELAFPAAKVRHEGEAGLWLMRALGERLSSRDATDSIAHAQAALEASAAARFKLGDGELESLRDQIAALPDDDQGVLEVPLSADPPPACRVGAEISWVPFASAAIDIEAFGMPGATVSNDLIRWTPPHAGRFRVVTVAGRPDEIPGWNYRQHEFVCLP